ncbi:hypothetical protein VTO42DRAFT_5352 [Malbranchea cinnamomea]
MEPPLGEFQIAGCSIPEIPTSANAAAFQGRNRHRRGLSLDQGLMQRHLYTPSPLNPHFQKLESIPQLQRPSTPVQQTSPDTLPQTPSGSPSRNWSRPSRVCKTAQSSPTKHAPLQTRMQRTKSLQGVTCSPLAQQNRRMLFPDSDPLRTPVKSEPQVPEVGDPFSEFNFPIPGDVNDASYYSPGSSVSAFLSFPETPGERASDLKQEEGSPTKLPSVPTVGLFPTSHRTANSSPCSSPVKATLTSRPLSIAALNLDSGIDASIEHTGITMEDIAAYMEGPDPEDNKWICTYNGCNRRFGRKENIKSHIQTHLGDRQFKCNHCNKCFVRGHDLKRHAKIHTGIRSYPCECGSTFARHDALTRHKQRGMCSGAFEGAVRRVRRGRPRKGNEKQDKVAKLKRRAKSKPVAISTTSQVPSATLASPLSESFDTASTRTTSPVKELELFKDDSICLPPDVFTFTPPASPSHNSRNLPSPTKSYAEGLLCLSPHKHTLDDIPEEVLETNPMTAKPPTPVKVKQTTAGPAQFLWPNAAESMLADDPANHEFDVFTSHSTGSSFELPPFEGPSSTPGMTESNNSTEYEDDLFFNHTQQDDADFFSVTFSNALDDHRPGFFDTRFPTEISSGAL